MRLRNVFEISLFQPGNSKSRVSDKRVEWNKCVGGRRLKNFGVFPNLKLFERDLCYFAIMLIMAK